MSDIKYAYPLILNKVASPQYATPTLRRARLLEWLDKASDCRAAVIAADAGYGKTTLLWQWEREAQVPVYWYKLDRNDRDWTFHISYLIEAISKRHRGFGRRAHSMLQQLGGPGSARPGVAAYLLAEMHEQLTEPCTFIIDDWQYVNSATEVRGLWNQILRDAPPTCRFIFASRAKPGLQFARFKTHSGYAELRTDALRFTEAEIDELFRDIYNDPLDPTELVELERRTEGWAASLQLVEVSLRERTTPEGRRDFIQSITATTDSDLFDFLAEEVLDQQPEETRNFLLTTSILQQITPEVAERLAGVHDGRRELTELEHRGLFTSRLDEERFRYHNLFREFLERRLISERSEAEVIGLHIHAASYFETTEQWPEAIHHYLRAGLHRQAARLIAKHGEAVAEEGRLGLVDVWIRQLPAEAIRQNARLSLLFGETSGMRGDWDLALQALTRARAYFQKKGDKRLESLACLKLSSVYSNYGDSELSAGIAESGAALVPADAVGTRLRLEGNLAITKLWSAQPYDLVVRECQRIAVEAAARGFDHFAAIALHNAGGIQLRMGRAQEAVTNLEKAAKFWSGTPTNPFADNSELVGALLVAGRADQARKIAVEAVERTRPWPRPHSDALYGHAAVLLHEGLFDSAVAALNEAAATPAVLGAAHGPTHARLVEALYLAEAEPSVILDCCQSLNAGPVDSRYSSEIAPAVGIGVHLAGGCGKRCQDGLAGLHQSAAQGGQFLAITGAVKLGVLGLDHGGKRDVIAAWQAVALADQHGYLPILKWWVRRYVSTSRAAVSLPNGADLIARLVEADPEGWRIPAAQLLPLLSGAARSTVLSCVARYANRETVDALSDVPGQDVLEIRQALRTSQAARLFLRTMGGISLRRGSWDGPAVHIAKRRVRALLAVLAAHSHTILTRDQALDLLWPDADADSAINSLNQTVFQLRRHLDPGYRGGESPEYIMSSAESVGLSSDLIRTDVDEIKRLALRLTTASWVERQGVARRLTHLVRGEFLADLRYESWASRLQGQVHQYVRSCLLPIANGAGSSYDNDVALEAASALVSIDPFDEAATLALAECLSAGGRRVAARDLLLDFARLIRDELDEPPSEAVERAAERNGTAAIKS